ncbi:hemolysin family protein [Staphylococcus succinus]|uniref:hemolysin family protein n=1 Tax=Staphylococcus succinus TaxID=61015 RepID=UPI000A665D14|nr:CNNM domain-containing protein [Staphylococcus succinus]MEB7461989.1 CNNM domain-containing protein [Staphylococcus succinus]PTI47636.1 hemolysin [Staphylococcus succinus]
MIIVIIILLFASFFFSGSETALTTVNRIKIQTEADQGNNKAAQVNQLLSKLSTVLTTMLIGKNIAKVILAALVTIIAIRSGVKVGILAALITVVVIAILEVIAKSFAAANPYKTSHLVYAPVSFFVMVFMPVTKVLNVIAGIVNNIIIDGKQENHDFSKDALRHMLAIADREGALNEMERERIQGVMNFEKLKIKDISTTPRINVTAFPSNISYEEAYDVIISKPYTRYPVYGNDMDHIIGVFHSKYLLAWSRETSNDILQYTSEPLFVNEHNKAEWVLRKMTVARKHLAIVLDEYGGTDAIVSHEDLIEEMLGMEIEDEMDEEEKEKLKHQMKAYNNK